MGQYSPRLTGSVSDQRVLDVRPPRLVEHVLAARYMLTVRALPKVRSGVRASAVAEADQAAVAQEHRGRAEHGRRVDHRLSVTPEVARDLHPAPRR